MLIFVLPTKSAQQVFKKQKTYHCSLGEFLGVFVTGSDAVFHLMDVGLNVKKFRGSDSGPAGFRGFRAPPDLVVDV